ncbi:hypothetical protein TpMuguga_02g00478 [Theileria parva strain Muguga]|uniref:uncharacterized protein n=1 Tax=Theileria parva strain Muguga TaxID=333668 RepID=UPI001C621E4D|nr:uncharacterized protein TpMuguga_02g00478 [Theileria parva strain Muguga]EAN32761.2 hypothetical protein TpMuguga_02g00478 [Theileria parva strain Muguga]
MSALRYKIKNCVQYYPVRSKLWKEIQYKRMKLGEWPPPNSSPLHPIEPWGKQLFVFNTTLNGNNETLLCVTDHTRKPLIYFYKEDFQALKLYIEKIKEELERLESTAKPDDDKYADSLAYTLNKSYTMQRMKTGRHSSHTIMRSVQRIKK